MRKLILIGLLMFFAVYSSPTAFASDVNVDPNVETVSSGPFLWKSDGTPSGTVLVKDIKAGDQYTNSDPSKLTYAQLFFAIVILY